MKFTLERRCLGRCVIETDKKKKIMLDRLEQVERGQGRESAVFTLAALCLEDMRRASYSCPNPSVSSIANSSFSFNCSKLL